MNIAFDPREWSAASPEGAADQSCAHPDWHVLRARLHAGREAWAMLGHARGGYHASNFGSFSRRATISLDGINRDRGPVNQTGLANRKLGGYIIPHVAGMTTIGERG